MMEKWGGGGEREFAPEMGRRQWEGACLLEVWLPVRGQAGFLMCREVPDGLHCLGGLLVKKAQ